MLWNKIFHSNDARVILIPSLLFPLPAVFESSYSNHPDFFYQI